MTLAALLASAALAGVVELGPASVWLRPGESSAVVESLHAECANEGEDRAGCLLAFMRRAGALPQAVDAARRIGEGKGEPEGWLGTFIEAGRVDFGYA
ncbi:MAG: hypothetical protein HY925_12805, partial [Elusimicrobia bacterium]|nr:hypothetical protein [Elusimicrobiota bacterium]